MRLALDCVGGQSTERLGKCLNEHGTVVNYGMLSLEPCVLSSEHLIFRNVNLVGFWLSRILNKMSAADRNQQVLQLADWVSEGKLKGTIDSTFSIEQISDAIRRSEQSGREGKVLLRPIRRIIRLIERHNHENWKALAIHERISGDPHGSRLHATTTRISECHCLLLPGFGGYVYPLRPRCKQSTSTSWRTEKG